MPRLSEYRDTAVTRMIPLAREVQYGMAMAKADRLPVQFSSLEIYCFGPEAGVKRRRRSIAAT